MNLSIADGFGREIDRLFIDSVLLKVVVFGRDTTVPVEIFSRLGLTPMSYFQRQVALTSVHPGRDPQ